MVAGVSNAGNGDHLCVSVCLHTSDEAQGVTECVLCSLCSLCSLE